MVETSGSMAAPPPSDEEREETLDRMLTRLALADDAKLQPLLASILPYSISSLTSSSLSVRKMVMEILTHINKRVKHHPEIGLPLLELWNIYNKTDASSMVRNFCIVYIEMSFERLPREDKENMAPELLANIANIPLQHQGIILRIVLKVIGDCHSRQVDENIVAKYGIIGVSKDEQVLLEFCLHTVLYQAPPPGVGCPAGLSIAQAERVTGKLPLKGDILMMRKLGILNLIEAMQLSPELVYPPSSCFRQSVAKKGEELLKRKAAGANLNDSDLIKRLFMLLNGSTGVENIAAELRVAPGSNTLRVSILAMPNCCHVTRAACLVAYQFVTDMVLQQRQAVLDQLKLMGPVILSGILRSLDGLAGIEAGSVGRDVKTFAYQAIGLLASRMPNLFRDKIGMAIRLFTALKTEEQPLRPTI